MKSKTLNIKQHQSFVKQIQIQTENMLLFILILLLRLYSILNMILRNFFRKVFNRIDDWISEGFALIIKSIDTEYVSVSIYSPLSGSSYIQLPVKLRNPMKGLINIKNNHNVFFGVILDV